MQFDGERRARINKRLLDALKPADARFIVWDDEIAGFGVRVEPTGRKTFLIRYRPGHGGRQAALRQTTIGAYGKLTPDAARNEARALLAQVELGGDPAGERRAQRNAKTVDDLATLYLNDYAKAAALRPSTIRDASGVLRLYALPALGRMAIGDVTPADIRRMHRAAADAAGRYQANRTLAFVSKLFSLATESGWRADSPCRGVKKYPEDRRDRVLNDGEVIRFFRALDAHPDPAATNALRLLLFTGARLNEVLKAEWVQFDLDPGVWIKPSAHTKQKRSHRLELDGPAIDLLRTMRAADPFGRYLFPGRSREAPRADLNRPWRWLKQAAELEGVRLHDLRHTLASYIVSNGVPLAVVGRSLGHTQPATTARYAHVADHSQRRAMATAGSLFKDLASRPGADPVRIGKIGG